MSQTTPIDPQDERWGGYVPWFFRYAALPSSGNLELFFQRLAQRLKRFFEYNEANITVPGHFGEYLESESLQKFRYSPTVSLATQIVNYFSPEQMKIEATTLCSVDKEARQLADLLRLVRLTTGTGRGIRLVPVPNKDLDPRIAEARKADEATRPKRMEVHFRMIAHIRLGVLEVLLSIVPDSSKWLPNLIRDIRRAFAEAKLPLDIKGTPALIVPLDETLLQREVIDRLLPRLSAQFPQQANDLTQAYHDLLQGADENTVFGNAFKSLEEIARQISGDRSLTLSDDKDIKKAFPLLHSTTHATIIKLAAHRGDKGAHGRQGPPLHEMRYLLLSICNIALLFMDYPVISKPLSNPG